MNRRLVTTGVDQRRWFIALLAVLVFAVGCTSKEPSGPAKPALPFEGVKLLVVVVDDPALADAARQFAGEWRAQTGAEFEISEVASADLSAKAAGADALIYPSHQLGELAERGLLKPVPKEVLADGRLAWPEVFEALRLREAAWGGQTYALPFGSPVFTCYYRADLFARFDKAPPKTWSEYQELVEFFGDRENLQDLAPAAEMSWSGGIEPLAEGWAGLALLARAAAYAKHPDFFSCLFDMESMEPLIAGPPFVRSLEELVAANTGSANQNRYTPRDVRSAFWAGQCAMAITWPTAAEAEPAAEGGKPSSNQALSVGFCELPGAEEVYDLGEQHWEPRAETLTHIPLLAVAGRLGSVAKSSPNAEAAFQLLVALSGSQWSDQVSLASAATTLYRQPHLRTARNWVEPQVEQQAARQYAAAVSTALGRQDQLFALRIRGRQQYLAALDQAVLQALEGNASPAEALKKCAERWREITEEIGQKQQIEAYRHSVLNVP